MTKDPWPTLLSGLALSFALLAPAGALAQTQQNAPGKPPAAEKQNTAYQQATEVERESWRQTILHTPLPKKGCFAAAFPETLWREIECKPPSTKLYPPKRPGMIRTQTVGGAGADFSAVVTGHILEAEGSFDSVSGVTGECDVPCDPSTDVCPVNPSCSTTAGATPNSFSLQLNSKIFDTQTCNGSNPVSTWTITGGKCQGWEQFVYSSSNSGSIQYWIENYGPPGTQCPTPRGAACVVGGASTDGWCPFQFTSSDPVYCVVNGSNFSGAPSQTIASLGTLKLQGAAAGFNGNADDAIYVTEGATVYPATGGNYFPDLGSQWQEVGSSRVDLQACKLEYSIVSPK